MELNWMLQSYIKGKINAIKQNSQKNQYLPGKEGIVWFVQIPREKENDKETEWAGPTANLQTLDGLFVKHPISLLTEVSTLVRH